RLLLRHDNADLRLAAHAFRLGLISEERFARAELRRRLADDVETALSATLLTPSREGLAQAESCGLQPLTQAMTAAEALCRPQVRYWQVRALVAASNAHSAPLPELPELPELDDDTAAEVELRVKYAGYIRKERQSVQRTRRLEEALLPEALDYSVLLGLRHEESQQLT